MHGEAVIHTTNLPIEVLVQGGLLQLILHDLLHEAAADLPWMCFEYCV